MPTSTWFSFQLWPRAEKTVAIRATPWRSICLVRGAYLLNLCSSDWCRSPLDRTVFERGSSRRHHGVGGQITLGTRLDGAGRLAAIADELTKAGVCIKPAGGSFTYATPKTVPSEGDVLVVAGETDRADAFGTLP